jgi:hypothetical protein
MACGGLKPMKELDELIQRKYIIKFIKSQRLEWKGCQKKEKF